MIKLLSGHRLVSYLWAGLALLGTTLDVSAVAKPEGFVHYKPPKVGHIHFKYNKFRFGKFPKWSYPAPPTPPSTPPTGPTVNAHDYGAKGDGKTDNWQAFHNALMAAPNGTLYIPAGNYACSAPISLNNQSITGDGPSSIITGSFNSFNTGLIQPTGNCTIKQVAITFDAAHGGTTAGIFVNGTQGPVTITQCQLVGSFYFCVRVSKSANVTVSNCTIANTVQPNAPGPTCITFDNTSTILIANNNFSNLNSNPNLLLIASFPLGTSGPSSNVTISGNTFAGQNLSNYDIYLTYVNGVNITGNTFSFPMYTGAPTGYNGTPGGILIQGSAPQTGSSGPVTNVQITQNTFTDLQPLLNNSPQNAPIIVMGATAGTVQNVVVNQNSITQYPAVEFGCSLCCGIYAGGASPGAIQNFSASGNTMSTTAYAGIFVDGANNVAMTSNTVDSGYGLGIYSGPSNSGTLNISTNNITNCGIAPPTSSAVKYLGLSTKAAIDVEAATSVQSATIQNNSYGNSSQANNLQYDIYCALSHTLANVSGNQDATALPNFGPQ